jgi:predicted acylesterase/phospholipase RssA
MKEIEKKAKQQGKDVALVLSSGGARGLVHIGVIEELEEQGFHITSIAGCSMGALVGGMYAAGKLQDYREWMRTIDKRKMISLWDFSLSLDHIIKGEKVIEAMCADDRFEQMLASAISGAKYAEAYDMFCATVRDFEETLDLR